MKKMSSQKGITLLSIIIYIVAMVVVLSIIATLTTYFYGNVKNIGETINPMSEYTKFNTFFTETINKKNNKVIEYNNNLIAFSDGTQYTFAKINNDEHSKGNIYMGKVKIAQEIFTVRFEYGISNEGKEIVKVIYKLNEADTEEATSTFTLVS